MRDPRCPSDTALHGAVIDMFEGHIRRAPELVALDHGERRWNYRVLDDSAERLARLIVRAHGAPLRPETLVALCFAHGHARVAVLVVLDRCLGSAQPDPVAAIFGCRSSRPAVNVGKTSCEVARAVDAAESGQRDQALRSKGSSRRM
ncbi:MAG TPA: hypothetical protein VGE16_19375 [Albitalea sp.]